MRAHEAAAAGGLVTFGTAISVLSKVVYQLKGPGRGGITHYFRKPWAITLLTFVSMALVLPLKWLVAALLGLRHYWRRHPWRPWEWAPGVPTAEQPLLATVSEEGAVIIGRLGTGLRPEELLPADDEPRPPWYTTMAVVAIPFLCDLTAVALTAIGLLWVTASVYQMLRSAELVLYALFARALLRRRLDRFHWVGIGICMVGLGLVIFASLMAAEGHLPPELSASTKDICIALALILGAQAVQAVQVTAEDAIMEAVRLDALTVVGCEGVMGSITVGGLILPMLHFMPGPEGRGFHEDAVDTLLMLRSAPHIRAACALLGVCLVGYNIAGMWTPVYFGSYGPAVLECLRTSLVWAISVLLYYAPSLVEGHEVLGEPWITPASLYQLAGFIMIALGSLLYAEGDERRSMLHKRAAASKVPGEVVQVNRHHAFKPMHALWSGAWEANAIRGAERHRLSKRGARRRQRELEERQAGLAAAPPPAAGAAEGLAPEGVAFPQCETWPEQLEPHPEVMAAANDKPEVFGL